MGPLVVSVWELGNGGVLVCSVSMLDKGLTLTLSLSTTLTHSFPPFSHSLLSLSHTVTLSHFPSLTLSHCSISFLLHLFLATHLSTCLICFVYSAMTAGRIFPFFFTWSASVSGPRARKLIFCSVTFCFPVSPLLKRTWV